MGFLTSVLNAVKRRLLGTGVRIGFAISTYRTGYKRMATYFKDSEVEGLDPELVSKLDTARKVAGVPFVITSGKRAPEENERAMGVEGSAHISGKAVDLRVPGSRERFLMLKGLFAAGFTRIGVYNAHIHVDTDSTKDPDVVWVGVSH